MKWGSINVNKKSTSTSGKKGTHLTVTGKEDDKVLNQLKQQERMRPKKKGRKERKKTEEERCNYGNVKKSTKYSSRLE